MSLIERFKVASTSIEALRNTVYLIHDNWDDWFTYETQYKVIYINEMGHRTIIGYIKIGQKGQKARIPNISEEFEYLSEEFFSLGASEFYYENLKKLPFREELLVKLRDIAYSTEIFEDVKDEDVVRVSLFRDFTQTTIKGQLRRMAQGGARLTNYEFVYELPNVDKELLFDVEADNKPPTNIHVLIGKNGVGKTSILKNMLYAVEQSGEEKIIGRVKGSSFANVVFVSFSAFDRTTSIEDFEEKEMKIPYSFVGLVKEKSIKGGKELASDFVDSLYLIVKSQKKKLWEKAIDVLESDNTFTELNVKEWSSYLILDDDIKKTRRENETTCEYKKRVEKECLEDKITPIFLNLSSGHKVILLTIAKLVELVEEKTLVFLDEPEGHLHPPLVAAFIRALSDLLTYRNGVGIIATHSPVIVQEVPRRCVWILRRRGHQLAVERPRIETFGENLGELTSEIFGYEVINSGFHKLLSEAVSKNDTYREALEYFDNELGKEGKSILKSYMYEKEKEE